MARFRVGRILVCSWKSLLLLSGGRFEGVSRPLRYYDAKEAVFQCLADILGKGRPKQRADV